MFHPLYTVKIDSKTKYGRSTMIRSESVTRYNSEFRDEPSTHLIQSKSLVQCTKQTAAKTDGLSTAVDKLRDQLPPPPIAPQYGMYEGLTEQAVAALDCREDSILVFAGKLDRALFKRTSRPHQERDQVQLQWLIEVRNSKQSYMEKEHTCTIPGRPPSSSQFGR